MYFTQDDYKKIEKWLQRNSIKDTELDEVAYVDGNETVAIVQDDKNKRVYIRDLVHSIKSLLTPDFINATETYGLVNTTLEEVIKAIPEFNRQKGLVVTFEHENNWYIYQFKGELTQWNLIEYWDNLLDFNKYVFDLFLPDEEDLTIRYKDENNNAIVGLKDRQYEEGSTNGMGYKILRKNPIEVEIDNGIKTINFLYLNMINEPNTIYEIRYDFDLNSQEINIPENSVLKFTGGKLINGTIKFNNTYINSSYKSFENISFSGSMLNSVTNIVIFGADNTGKKDATSIILNLLDINKNVFIPVGKYLCKDITVPSNSKISGEGSSSIIVPSNDTKLAIFYLKDASKVEISNLSISGNTTSYITCIYGYSSTWMAGFYDIHDIYLININGNGILLPWGAGGNNVHDIWIENMLNRIGDVFSQDLNNWGIGINALCNDSLFSNLYIGWCYSCGMKTFGGNLITNSKIWGCGSHAIDLKGAGLELLQDYNLVSNVTLEENSGAGLICGGAHNNVICSISGTGADVKQDNLNTHFSSSIIMRDGRDWHGCRNNHIIATLREPGMHAKHESLDAYLSYDVYNLWLDKADIFQGNVIELTCRHGDKLTTIDKKLIDNFAKYYWLDTLTINGYCAKARECKLISRYFPILKKENIDILEMSDGNIKLKIKQGSPKSGKLIHILSNMPALLNIDELAHIYFYSDIWSSVPFTDNSLVNLSIVESPWEYKVESSKIKLDLIHKYKYFEAVNYRGNSKNVKSLRLEIWIDYDIDTPYDTLQEDVIVKLTNTKVHVESNDEKYNTNDIFPLNYMGEQALSLYALNEGNTYPTAAGIKLFSTKDNINKIYRMNEAGDGFEDIYNNPVGTKNMGTKEEAINQLPKMMEGQSFFCTDINTTEETSTNGIMIYKSNGILVDALGRPIQ